MIQSDKKNDLQKVTNIYGMITVWLWYYYHGSNEQRVIEKIRLLFFYCEWACMCYNKTNWQIDTTTTELFEYKHKTAAINIEETHII